MAVVVVKRGLSNHGYCSGKKGDQHIFYETQSPDDSHTDKIDGWKNL